MQYFLDTCDQGVRNSKSCGCNTWEPSKTVRIIGCSFAARSPFAPFEQMIYGLLLFRKGECGDGGEGEDTKRKWRGRTNSEHASTSTAADWPTHRMAKLNYLQCLSFLFLACIEYANTLQYIIHLSSFSCIFQETSMYDVQSILVVEEISLTMDSTIHTVSELHFWPIAFRAVFPWCTL